MPAARLTHFLCLPLVTQHSKPQLQLSLQDFAASVTNTHDVPPKAIRPIGTIHLTLGVMQLATEEQIKAACVLLRSLDLVEMLRKSVPPPQAVEAKAAECSIGSLQKTLTGVAAAETELEMGTAAQVREPDPSAPPLKVSMVGLESMHNPSKTSILYTSPYDPTSRLQPFATALRDAFICKNLLVLDNRPLLLHATIVNTLYAKTKFRAKVTGHGKNNRGVGKIDARALLEEFREFEWAKDFRIERVSICQMGAKKEIFDGVVVNEEYTEVASVPLP
ncbi:hypothetical protein G7Y79_00060g092700 [Physcia stellaris]|nr:hypothetical protein G7Y79_00060g092700 [Physcia stellaris]